jgi:mannose-1-phosphate guanylyltransferase
MHDYPRFNSVSVANGRIAGFREQGDGSRQLAFTGISVIDPGILTTIPGGQASCIIDHYQALLNKGAIFAAYRTDTCFWTDMGTPQDYLDLHAGLLSGVIPRWEELGHDGKGSIFVDNEAQLSENTRLSDWCCIGRAKCIDARLARVVIWDGVELPVGYCAEDALISATPGTWQGDVRAEKEGKS